jgi:hypothetical protein
VAAEPLATIDDLIERLGRDLTTAEAPRAAAALLDASASVRRFTRQHFTRATSTERLKISTGHRIRLPQRPVVSITSIVTVTGTAEDGIAVSYTWDGLDDLCVWNDIGSINASNPRWPGRRVVDVTYVHGYLQVDMPDDIVGITCQVAARALGRKPDESGITSETVPDYAYTVNAAAVAGPFGLLADEKEALEVYRRPAAPIRTSAR